MRTFINCLLFTVLIYSVSSTINPSKIKKGKQKVQEAVVNKGPKLFSVYERNLVDSEPLASDIVAEAHTYYKERSLKNFNGTVLGYVTPVSSYLMKNLKYPGNNKRILVELSWL